ncbi:hypothetical protein [Actinokineospora sp.]|uniref:hypothetical protein n=1 Tax=Actinokineospora sp. TaxID=1872133 RepID=UPI0040384757
MVHRSIIGSVERAVAHLIELRGGAFPGRLAPTQLAVLPISDAELPRPPNSSGRASTAGCARRSSGRTTGRWAPASGPPGSCRTRP